MTAFLIHQTDRLNRATVAVAVAAEVRARGEEATAVRAVAAALLT